jgi:membrane protein implicated in regulation of membrane protease activity
VKTFEMIVLGMLIFGLVIFSIGLLIYIQKLMLTYSLDWSLQLAVFGAYITVLALILAKLFQKVTE